MSLRNCLAHHSWKGFNYPFKGVINRNKRGFLFIKEMDFRKVRNACSSMKTDPIVGVKIRKIKRNSLTVRISGSWRLKSLESLKPRACQRNIHPSFGGYLSTHQRFSRQTNEDGQESRSCNLKKDFQEQFKRLLYSISWSVNLLPVKTIQW